MRDEATRLRSSTPFAGVPTDEERTPVLSKDWRSRLVAVINENTNRVIGLYLEVHDLAVSKILAQRPKDVEFVQELVRHGMIQK